jgi:hypothetical protein
MFCKLNNVRPLCGFWLIIIFLIHVFLVLCFSEGDCFTLVLRSAFQYAPAGNGVLNVTQVPYSAMVQIARS